MPRATSPESHTTPPRSSRNQRTSDAQRGGSAQRGGDEQHNNRTQRSGGTQQGSGARKSPSRRNRKPKSAGSSRPTDAPRNGAIVLNPDGVAGKAPKRYTRSSAQNNGRRPVTRSLTKSQVKRNRGRSYPETSAGGMVLRGLHRAYNPRTNRVHLSTVEVALIGRTDRRGRLLWSLPKGHIEDYETVPMTAVREVREETGIEGEVIKHLGSIDYWFLSDGKRIHKTVHHYLLRFVSGELSNADAEISEVKWVPIKDLPTHLSYADERKLARRATGVVVTWIRDTYGNPGEKSDPGAGGNPREGDSPRESSEQSNRRSGERNGGTGTSRAGSDLGAGDGEGAADTTSMAEQPKGIAGETSPRQQQDSAKRKLRKRRRRTHRHRGGQNQRPAGNTPSATTGDGTTTARTPGNSPDSPDTTGGDSPAPRTAPGEGR